MKQANRQLFAILFADIQGYTALMQSNESHALALLQHFETTLQHEVTHAKGEIIKAYGDGCVVLFNSAVHAVQCAQNIQRHLQTEPAVPLRIGIHVGDIVRRGQDVFGNGVNIASRIESMGIPNSILISDNVYKEISNQPDIKTAPLGQFRFKNVHESIPLYAISSEGLSIPTLEEMRGKGSLDKSSRSKRFGLLALIPFVVAAFLIWKFFIQPSSDHSIHNGDNKLTVAALPFDIRGSEDIQYFEEGIMDLVSSGIDGLLRVNSLDPQIVMTHLQDPSRSFDDVLKNEVWDKYGIDYFITGSMLELGNNYKLISTLFDRTGNKASVIEVPVSDLGQIQGSIDFLIKDHIKQILQKEGLPEETATLQIDLDISTLKSFLEAEHNYRRANYSKAIDLYQAVIEADSSFALAYFGIANSALAGPTSSTNPRWVLLALSNITKAYEKREGAPRPIKNIIEAKYNLCFIGDFRAAIRKLEQTLNEYGPNISLYKELGLAYVCTNFIDNKSIAESRRYFEKAMDYDSMFQEVINVYVPILVRANELTKAKEILSAVPITSHLYLIAQSWLYYLQDHTHLNSESFLTFKNEHGQYPIASNLEFMSFDLYKKIADFEKLMIQEIPNLVNDLQFGFRIKQKKLLKGQFSEVPPQSFWYFQYNFLDHSFHPYSIEETDSLLNHLVTTFNSSRRRNSYFYTNQALLSSHLQGIEAYETGIDSIFAKGQILKAFEKDSSQQSNLQLGLGRQHSINSGRQHLHYNYQKLQAVKHKHLLDFEMTKKHLDSLFQRLTFNFTPTTTWTFYYASKFLEAEAERLSHQYHQAIKIYKVLLELPDPYYFGPAHLRLAQCHDALGEYDIALDYYNKFLYIYAECDDFWQHNVKFAKERREELIRLLG